ncbi:MAG: DUF6794 domain-containing protein [Hydrogenoanaerobacterium sp.]
MDLFAEIEKSFPYLEKLLSKEKLKSFISCNRYDFSLYRFGLGTWIRNNLLYEKSSLYKAFIKVNIVSLDDMSSVIIQLFYDYEKEKYKSLEKNSAL